MTKDEAFQYIKQFLLLRRPKPEEVEKFKLALKIASTLQRPN